MSQDYYLLSNQMKSSAPSSESNWFRVIKYDNKQLIAYYHFNVLENRVK